MTQPLSDLFDTGRVRRFVTGRKRRRYLALFLPWLPAERIFAVGLASPHHPLALVAKERGALRLATLCAQASALGLAPGMALADARAQVPDLATRPHQSAGDAALLDRLVRRASAFSPTVEADPPQGLIIDIAGCSHLFGGEEAMREKVMRHMATAMGDAHPLTVQAAFADTPDAARALARFGGSDTRALPLFALALPENVRHGLSRAGFRRLGDLADLPRGPLAARFGGDLLVELDRLLGREDRHIAAPIVLPPLIFEMRFAEPIGRDEDVLDAVEQLMEEGARTLAERGQGGRAFAVRLFRSDGHIAELAVETGEPTRDTALVLRLLRERIGSLADPLDPGFGYDMMRLAMTRTDSLSDEQQQLDGQGHGGGDIAGLLDRLAVRHGKANLSCFSGENSHIPERAGLLRGRGAGSWQYGVPESGEPPLRPLFLFDPPQKVDVLAAVPDGPPRRFKWRGKMHRIRASEGPERIGREWWRRAGGHLRVEEEDGNPGLTRDYYRAEDEEGHRFWLFRLGLYERETDWPDWYVHGLFA